MSGYQRNQHQVLHLDASSSRKGGTGGEEILRVVDSDRRIVVFETYSHEHNKPAVFVDEDERQLFLLFDLCESCGAYYCWRDPQGNFHECYLVEFGCGVDWYSREDLEEIFNCR